MRKKINRTEPRGGGLIVEVALVLPILIVFTFGILEYGRFLMVHNLIQHAAREGARFAVVRTDDDATVTQDIIDFVEGRLAGQEHHIVGLNVQVYKVNPDDGSSIGSWRDAAFGEEIAVRISGNYQPVTSSLLFMPNAIAVQSVSMMKSEAN